MTETAQVSGAPVPNSGEDPPGQLRGTRRLVPREPAARARRLGGEVVEPGPGRDLRSALLVLLSGRSAYRPLPAAAARGAAARPRLAGATTGERARATGVRRPRLVGRRRRSRPPPHRGRHDLLRLGLPLGRAW